MLSPIKETLRNVKVVLASSSPQRKKLLEQIGLEFKVLPSPFDEEIVQRDSFHNPRDYVKCVAHQKALAVAETFRNFDNKVLVIGADTVIIYNGKIIGKPYKADVANETLTQLSGNQHSVCTGVSIIKVDSNMFSETIFDETTTVQFGKLSREEIESYIETGEPLNKAGAYGIQGIGALLVEKINGDYNNVVGFPVYKFSKELLKFMHDERT